MYVEWGLDAQELEAFVLFFRCWMAADFQSTWLFSITNKGGPPTLTRKYIYFFFLSRLPKKITQERFFFSLQGNQSAPLVKNIPPFPCFELTSCPGASGLVRVRWWRWINYLHITPTTTTEKLIRPVENRGEKKGFFIFFFVVFSFRFMNNLVHRLIIMPKKWKKKRLKNQLFLFWGWRRRKKKEKVWCVCVGAQPLRSS